MTTCPTAPASQTIPDNQTHPESPVTLATLSSQLRTISSQQETICAILNDIVTALDQEAEGSLIDELSELLAPLLSDVAAIKNHLSQLSAVQPPQVS